jgi:AcrR family transcriptional regulator
MCSYNEAAPKVFDVKMARNLRLNPSHARDAGTANPTADALLSAARVIFAAEGIQGLSLRRVAQQARCTTIAVYTRFGGKNGLIGALYDDGFAELANAQAKAQTQTTANAVRKKLAQPDHALVLELCKSYRATAQRFPNHYALMLGAQSGLHAPSQASQNAALATLATLRAAVLDYLDASKKELADPLTLRLFAFCHGWVGLEQLGFLANAADDAFEASIVALLLPSSNAQPKLKQRVDKKRVD